VVPVHPRGHPFAVQEQLDRLASVAKGTSSQTSGGAANSGGEVGSTPPALPPRGDAAPDSAPPLPPKPPKHPGHNNGGDDGLGSIGDVLTPPQADATAESASGSSAVLNEQHRSLFVVAGGLHVGSRVKTPADFTGTIQFCGHVHFALGVWVGVLLDGPDGEGDGTVGTGRYMATAEGRAKYAPRLFRAAVPVSARRTQAPLPARLPGAGMPGVGFCQLFGMLPCVGAPHPRAHVFVCVCVRDLPWAMHAGAHTPSTRACDRRRFSCGRTPLWL